MIPKDPICPLVAPHLERRKAVLDVLEKVGFPREDWLAAGLERQFPSWDPGFIEDKESIREDGQVRWLLSAAMARWQDEPIRLRDVALYNLLTIARHALKLEVGPLVVAMRGHVDFTNGLAAPQVSLHESLVDQARWLLSQNLINPSSINWARIETLATIRPLMVRKHYWEIQKVDGNDPRSPVFWLAISPQETWAEFLAMVNAVEDTARRALLYRGYLAACLARPELHGYKYNPPDFRDAEALMLLPLIEHLAAHVASLPAEVAGDLTETWLLAWHHLHWTVPSLEMPHLELAIESAKKELGRIRPLLRAAKDDPFAASAFKRLEELFEHCAEILYEFCPLWEATRPLIFALRDCSLPTVASDLRYWSDDSHEEPAPDPWKSIPATLVHCLHFYTGEEQTDDEKLIKFRTQFARFCLERLKPNPKTGLPYEQDIHWRRGYVEAARKLCVNPDGRGHRILHQVAEHEPDPMLRQLAKRAYDVLRKGPKIPDSLSPRRVVFQAFLELRRAHLLALGCSVDWNRAKTKTSELEARRTTEPEEEVKPQ